MNTGPAIGYKVRRKPGRGAGVGAISRKLGGFEQGLTADLERRLKLQKNRLAQENLPGFEAQTTDLVLC